MKKLIARIKYWLKIKPKWNQCRYASCWDGSNAQRRMMNILSPNMDDAKFAEYVKWMQDRGCDTAHVILVNQADGENAGYNAAQGGWALTVARRRIRKLRIAGFAVVPWLITDDSPSWRNDLFAHPEERIKTLADAGIFDHASYVVLGLEMDEAGAVGTKGWPSVAAALKKFYKGKVGVHHCSGNKFPYAGLGDIILGQLDPKTATEAAIRNQIGIIKGMGKEAVGFEYERHPDRAKAMAALNAGAVGVGNW